MLTANKPADTRGNHKDLGGSCHGTHIGRLGVNDLHMGARKGEELRHRTAHDGAPPHHNRATPADFNLVRSQKLHDRCGSCWEERSVKVTCAQARGVCSRDSINVFLRGNPSNDAGSVHSFREW